MFIEVFNELLEDNGMNRKQFAEKSGIPYTTVVGWTKLGRLPDYNALIKIADFFKCSTDLLTERQTENDNYFSVGVLPSENALIKNYRKLSTENKELVLKLSKNLLDTENNNR